MTTNAFDECMRKLPHLLAFFLWVTSNLLAEDMEPREWTSSGGHKVEAVATALVNGKVVLKRANGKEIRVPLLKLVSADQELLKKHFAAEEAKLGELVRPDEGEVAGDLPHPLGKTTAELSCGSYHYFLYLPKSLRNGEQHPVLFVMNPGGGKPGTAKRYVQGAERNRWIIAISKESKNGFASSERAIAAMVKEVTGALPVDKKRLYTSGFSGGCRMAFSAASKHKIQGIIACGAGASDNFPKSSQTTYGLCGTKCFNRHDMACTFKKIKNRDSILRFFPGNHNWANAELIDDAITHLNGVFLTKNASKYPDQLARYEAAVAELIQSGEDKSPMRSMMWSSFAVEHELTGANEKLIAAIHRQLSETPSNVIYVKGLKDVGQFAISKLGTSPMAYKSLSAKVAAACKREAPKYGGTPWEKILQEMALPCSQP